MLWLASFVCVNRIFLEKETEGRMGHGGKEAKGTNNNLKWFHTSSRPISFCGVSVLIRLFDPINLYVFPAPYPNYMITLENAFSFVHMNTPQTPVIPALFQFTSAKVIWLLGSFYSFTFYSWYFVPNHILSFKDCIVHHLVLFCTKTRATQITDYDMMYQPSLRKSPLTHTKRPIFLWWRSNLLEITVCSV